MTTLLGRGHHPLLSAHSIQASALLHPIVSTKRYPATFVIGSQHECDDDWKSDSDDGA